MGKLIGAAVFPHAPITIEEIGKERVKEAEQTVDGLNKLSKIILDKKPSTIIFISPHGLVFKDALSVLSEDELYGDFSNFGNSNIQYKFNNNLNLLEKIIDKSLEENIPIVKIDSKKARLYGKDGNLDHGVLVPLYFIDKYYKNFNIISIAYAGFEREKLFEFGKILRQASDESDEEVLLIASGDLSHRLNKEGNYDYSPMGKVFDEKIVKLIENSDMDGIMNFDTNISDGAGECGLRSFQIMAGALEDQDIESTVYSYEGPFGVGYMTAFIERR